MNTRSRSHAEGFALVLSLIILTLLAISVVGFLSSSAIDRATARAAANKVQAEVAAQAAVNRAMGSLTDTVARFPDSATCWEQLTPSTGGTGVEGTLLYYNDQAPTVGADTASAPKRYVLPLFSTGTDSAGKPIAAQLATSKDAALGTETWDDNTSIDINRQRFNGDEYGWVGAAPAPAVSGKAGTPVRKPYRAKWIEVKADTSANAKTVSRYAFWVEDESFRLNLNQLGAKNRGNETVSPGALPQELPYQGFLTSTYLPGGDALANKLFTARTTWVGQGLPELRSFNLVDSASFGVDEKAKFLSTIYSGGLNLSRQGFQRLNLNGLGFEETAPAISEVGKNIKRLTRTIDYTTPNFYQRFYRKVVSTDPAKLNAMDVSAGYKEIYLAKIAANIRDYIDPDNYPTIILAGGNVAERKEPVNAFSTNQGLNEVWAQGKDGAPFIQEVLTRYRGSAASNRFDLQTDYYIEFWNMTDQDVYAGPQAGKPELRHLGGAFVRISNQMGWVHTGDAARDLIADNPISLNIGKSVNSTEQLKRDMILDLVNGVTDKAGKSYPTGVVFRANSCTVITTDPDSFSSNMPAANSNSIDKSQVFVCSKISNGLKQQGYRRYKGPITGGSAGFRAFFRQTSTGEDYETEVILANDQGYLESVPFAFSFGGGSTTFTTTTKPPNDDQLYGGSIYGNASSKPTPSQTGDPRTNNEQINITPYISGSTSQPDQTRYFNSSAYTLGAPNSVYTVPQKSTDNNAWGDYYHAWEPSGTGSANQPNPPADAAPAFILNKNLQSIGQLGDIFDPARYQGTVGSLGIEGSRGGGRTLKIGQIDDRISPVPTDKSREWASYRLTDTLATNALVQNPGLININGVFRDNGAALRAACNVMTLKSANRQSNTFAAAANGDKSLSTDETKTTGIMKLVSDVEARIASTNTAKPNGPLMERGEIGDFDAFSLGTTILDNINMAYSFDHSREELSRRLMELITTRGSIFSVYAVGQSISEGPAPARKRFVTATHQVKVTFQLVPVWKGKNSTGGTITVSNPTGLDAVTGKETWDPTSDEARKDRFTKPDHYDVQVLQVSS